MVSNSTQKTEQSENSSQRSRKPTLFLDTTANTLMAAVQVDGAMAFTLNEASTSHRYHSAILLPELQKGLKRLNLKPKAIKNLAVNVGPGSFTGIRTGLITIRTLAQFLEIPVYAFNTFDILASHQPGKVTSVYINALQGNAYHAVLKVDENGPQYLTEPTMVSLPYSSQEDAEVLIISEKLKDHFENQASQTLEALSLFSPEFMARLLRLNSKAFLKPWQEVVPLYLQEPNITLKKPKTTK